MEDIVQAVKERLKAPYFGYSFLAFVFLNWRAFYILIKTKGMPVDRLAAFDSATNNLNLMVWPFLIGAIAMVLRPWLGLVEGVLRIKPESLALEMKFRSESQSIKRQHKLDSDRRDVLASIEKDLIERAKRDQEINEISDEKLKEKLRVEITDAREGATVDVEEEIFKKNSRAIDVFKAIVKNNGEVVIDDGDGDGNSNSNAVYFKNERIGGENKYLYLLVFEALKVFVRNDWLERKGEESNIYELTLEGWRKAEKLGLVG